MEKAAIDNAFTAMYYIGKYRYLTVAQVALIIGLKEKSSSELLLRLQRRKFLGFFGNVGIRGYGKTPKVYFLTKSGQAVLSEEGEFYGLDIQPYKPVNITRRWSPMMYHRIATIDVMLALESACLNLEQYVVLTTLIEYRREKVDDKWVGETTDWIADAKTSDNRIVPDAGFIIENIETGRRALFLVEVDRGTETHMSKIPDAVRRTFRHKIEQYDRYLLSKRCKQRYSKWGEFENFVLLIITETEARIDNMRRALSDLAEAGHRHYRFSTYDNVMKNFFHAEWKGRSASDTTQYAIIKGREKA